MGRRRRNLWRSSNTLPITYDSADARCISSGATDTRFISDGAADARFISNGAADARIQCTILSDGFELLFDVNSSVICSTSIFDADAFSSADDPTGDDPDT